ncbi:MAG: hypothetical protein RL705_1072 [Bacteroidota bacterium]|jgi:hypothetical protein
MAWEVSVMAIPAVRSNLFGFVKPKRISTTIGAKKLSN